MRPRMAILSSEPPSKPVQALKEGGAHKVGISLTSRGALIAEGDSNARRSDIYLILIL